MERDKTTQRRFTRIAWLMMTVGAACVAGTSGAAYTQFTAAQHAGSSVVSNLAYAPRSLIDSDSYLKFYQHALDHDDKGAEYTVQLQDHARNEWRQIPRRNPNNEITGIEGEIPAGTMVVLKDHTGDQIVLFGDVSVTTLADHGWNDRDEVDWKWMNMGARPPHTRPLPDRVSVQSGWMEFYNENDLGGTRFKTSRFGEKQSSPMYPPRLVYPEHHPNYQNNDEPWRRYVVEFPGNQNDRTRSVAFNLPEGVYAVLTNGGKGRGKPVLLWGSGVANVQNRAWGNNMGVSSLVFYTTNG